MRHPNYDGEPDRLGTLFGAVILLATALASIKGLYLLYHWLFS
jgi:hypothetical protein